MKKVKFELDDNKKILIKLPIIFLLAVILLSAIGANTYAWLTYKSKMTAVSPVMAPNPYQIKGPNGAATEPMYIPQIDIADEDKDEELFFFSIIGRGEYKIQLGYTTNIPYVYHLYRLGAPSTESGELVCEYEDSVFYFDYYENNKVDILGAPLNDNSPSDSVGDEDSKYFGGTYNEDDVVQQNARPIYRQTIDAQSNSPGTTGYYVLVIDFAEIDRDGYSEETDVICIVVGE